MNKDLQNINDALLVKHLLGEADIDEQQQIQQWIKASEANRKYYDHFKLLWDESKKLEQTSTVNVDAAWQQFQTRVAPKQKSTTAVAIPIRKWLSAAAILLLAIGSGLLYYFKVAGGEMIVAQSGETTQIDTLSDGSVVTLNKNSSLSYPRNFKKDRRIVSLTGEAFFSVAPDKKRPFIIHSGEADIKVVGTTFNVKNTPGKTEVVVETGIVEVAKKKYKIKVLPHERAMVLQEQLEPVKQNNTDELYKYYRTKEFVCNSTPLWQLVDVLNNTYNVHIIITSERAKRQQLTTTFKDEPLKNILAVICETFNLKTVYKGNDIFLSEP